LNRSRIFSLILSLVLSLTLCCAAAESAVPDLLRDCVEKDHVMDFLDFPGEEPAEVIPGRIRYIAQSTDAEHFVKAYWLGGEEGS